MIQKMMLALVCCFAASQVQAQGVWDTLAARLAGYETRIAAAVATMDSLETDRDTLEARLLAAIQCDCCSSELEAANTAGFALGQAISDYGTEYAMITTNVTTCQGHWPACLDPVACADDLDYLALATTSLEGKVTASQTALAAFETAIEAYEACLEVTLTSQATIDALNASLDALESELELAGLAIEASVYSANDTLSRIDAAQAEHAAWAAHRCPAAVNNTATTNMATQVSWLNTREGELREVLDRQINGLLGANHELDWGYSHLSAARERTALGPCMTADDIVVVGLYISYAQQNLLDIIDLLGPLDAEVVDAEEGLDDFMVAFYNYKAYILYHCGPLP